MKIIKHGLSIFDSSKKEFGGFNHFLAGKIFRWKLTHLDIYLKKNFKLEIRHNDNKYYYDYYHNHIWFCWILLEYGTGTKN